MTFYRFYTEKGESCLLNSVAGWLEQIDYCVSVTYIFVLCLSGQDITRQYNPENVIKTRIQVYNFVLEDMSGLKCNGIRIKSLHFNLHFIAKSSLIYTYSDTAMDETQWNPIKLAFCAALN